jgi:hypothetical protein
MKNCNNCNKSVSSFANAFHKLCETCNLKRLEESKYNKINKHTRIERKSSKTKETRFKRTVDKGVKDKKSKKVNKNIKLDELFYKECFNSCNDHKCEECNTQLPTNFKSDDGKILYRARYSHIIAKSIAPELRHIVKNINHLCFTCHQKWEFGNKKSMKIYSKNKLRLPKYFK